MTGGAVLGAQTQDPAQILPLHSDEDVVRLRKQVRDSMVAMGFGLIEQTKIITAASELARNTLRYGGGGEARIARVCDGRARDWNCVLSMRDRASTILPWR